MLELAIEPPVALHSRKFASRADWLAVLAGRQLQRRTVGVWPQIEKIVLRIEELRFVIADAEIEFPFDIAVVAIERRG